MAKTAEIVANAAALKKRFHETLSETNAHKAKPAALAAFRQSLKDCERAKIAPWRSVSDPLDVAATMILEADAKPLVAESIVGL
jgi:hypothetical protein